MERCRPTPSTGCREPYRPELAAGLLACWLLGAPQRALHDWSRNLYTVGHESASSVCRERPPAAFKEGPLTEGARRRRWHLGLLRFHAGTRSALSAAGDHREDGPRTQSKSSGVARGSVGSTRLSVKTGMLSPPGFITPGGLVKQQSCQRALRAGRLPAWARLAKAPPKYAVYLPSATSRSHVIESIVMAPARRPTRLT